MSKKPPTLTESERAAVGSALNYSQYAEVLASELSEEDFANVPARKAFVAIKAIWEDLLEVNPVSAQDRSGLPPDEVEALLKAGKTVSREALSTLVSDIRRVSDLRKVYNACSNTTNLASSSAKLEEVLEGLERELYKLDRAGSQEAIDGSDAMERVVDGVLERNASGGGPEVSTGLRDLDRAIIGLRPGKTIIVAARPGMGKTALSASLRRSVVAQGMGAIEFNLEMTAEEICERELSFRSRVNLRKILSARGLSEDELERIRTVRRDIRGELASRWFIDDRTYSIAGIRRRARIVSQRMARAGVKLGVVVLDYIQLAGDNGDGREQAVSAISRGCKLMSKELGCTVLALSQLNRACEARDDRRPMLSDLRESGSIEQDADIVIMVYRDHVYDSSAPETDAELLIRKHRSGPTGVVRCRYNGKLVVFENQDDSAVLTRNVQDA